MTSQHNNHMITYAKSRGRSFAKSTNQTITWESFCKILENPFVSEVPHSFFLSQDGDKQTNLKAEAGWLIAGNVADGDTLSQDVKTRTLISFDCDNITPDFFASIKAGTNPLCQFEFVLHTTRQHRADRPRIRIFLPTARPINPSLYHAISRIMAFTLDPTMESVDSVSFRARQIMFNPTCSSDMVAQYEYIRNDGDLLDHDKILKEWGDGHLDHDKLPRSAKKEFLQAPGDDAEDPRTKPEPIGAFCRAFTIQHAIAEFISTIYTRGADGGIKDRYSYAKGSTANGAVVQQNGLFIFSHHNTDLISERLCNAFDMVRYHRFGYMDADTPPATKMKNRPSYKAMVQMILENKKVRRALGKSLVDVKAMAEDQPETLKINPIFGGTPKTTESDFDKVLECLEYDNNNKIKRTGYNIGQILMFDPRFAGTIAYNTFKNRIVLKKSIKTTLEIVPDMIVKNTNDGDVWEEDNNILITTILEAGRGEGKIGWGIECHEKTIKRAIKVAALNDKFHPVLEWLDGLVWDGEKRLERFWIDYLGTDDTPYYRETAILFLVAAIARVKTPGIKWDHVPILQSPQGYAKSEFFKVLFSRSWTKELTVKFSEQNKAQEQMSGNWMMEIPELNNMTAAEFDVVKAWITLESDTSRKIYHEDPTTIYRQSVLGGTTNYTEILPDRENRRFWPMQIKVKEINVAKLAKEREQIFAEAMHIWQEWGDKMGSPELIRLVLSPEATAEAKIHQERARIINHAESNAGKALAWLNTPKWLSDIVGHENLNGQKNIQVLRCITTPRQVAVEGLDIEEKKVSSNKSTDGMMSQVMSYLEGWNKNGRRGPHKAIKDLYGHGHHYVRADATEQEQSQGWKPIAKNDGTVADKTDDEIPF